MIAKRLARNVFAAGCRATFILNRAERNNREKLVILCYHRILPREKKKQYFLPDLVVTPAAFDRHCLVLKKRYEVIPLSDAFEALRHQEQKCFKRPLAAITFDDGYRDNFNYAAPILARHGIHATFFIVTDLIGADCPPWFDILGKASIVAAQSGQLNESMEFWEGVKPPPECGFARPADQVRHQNEVDRFSRTLAARAVRQAKSQSPQERKSQLDQLLTIVRDKNWFSSDDLIMNETQLRELSRAGHEIGSHSRTHEILTQLDAASLKEEIVGSKEALEQLLSQPVRSFCYPNGDMDDRVVQAVADAGYLCATSVAAGNNPANADPYRLRRQFIHEERLLGLHGSASKTLLRMELCGLTAKSFLR